MGSVSVVILLPSSNSGAGLSKRREQGLIKTLVTEAAIEAFDKSVLHRFAGSDIMPIDMDLLAPFEDGHTGHLRAVVGYDRLRLCPSADKVV